MIELLGDETIFEEKIRAALSGRNSPDRVGESTGLLPASVLIGLYRDEDNEWQVLFTRRTDRVERHKGQVSFPGGMAELDDRDAVDTALREAREEIGIPRSCVNVLGSLGKMTTNTGFYITPVVAILCWPFVLHPAEAEVDRVFSVPFTWLANPSNHEERLFTRSNGSQDTAVFFSPYDGEVIWGVTARILVDFIQILVSEE